MSGLTGCRNLGYQPIAFIPLYLYMPLHDDGYVKYASQWTKTALLKEDFEELIVYRNKLAGLNLIGVYPDQIGYGNISQRIKQTPQFIISGTQTGQHKIALPEHFCKVTDVNIAQNKLLCEGPVQASSEAMTHAAIYLADTNVNTVIHIHHHELWQQLKNIVTTTDITITYGTPEMANAMFDAVKAIEKNKLPKIIITAGHQEGVFTFGSSMKDAYETLMMFYHEHQ